MWEDKETTAPIPSVAPDEEQSSALARTDSITDIEEPHKRFGKIQAMTMPELMETRFRVRPAVIDGLLPVGTGDLPPRRCAEDRQVLSRFADGLSGEHGGAVSRLSFPAGYGFVSCLRGYL